MCIFIYCYVALVTGSDSRGMEFLSHRGVRSTHLWKSKPTAEFREKARGFGPRIPENAQLHYSDIP